MARSRVRGVHLIPDLVLLGFAREVGEQAGAALLLSNSIVPRTLYANARAAFEAIAELAFLWNGEDYDTLGARARVAEQMELVRAREGVAGVLQYEGLANQVDLSATVDQAVEQEAAIWNQFAPGKGRLLYEARDYLAAERRARRFGWYGMNRVSLIREFGKGDDSGGEAEAMALSFYAVLSAQSHPSPRIDDNNLSFDGDGFSLGAMGEKVESTVAMGVAVACIAVKSALTVVTSFNDSCQEPPFDHGGGN